MITVLIIQLVSSILTDVLFYSWLSTSLKEFYRGIRFWAYLINSPSPSMLKDPLKTANFFLRAFTAASAGYPNPPNPRVSSSFCCLPASVQTHLEEWETFSYFNIQFWENAEKVSTLSALMDYWIPVMLLIHYKHRPKHGIKLAPVSPRWEKNTEGWQTEAHPHPLKYPLLMLPTPTLSPPKNSKHENTSIRIMSVINVPPMPLFVFIC